MPIITKQCKELFAPRRIVLLSPAMQSRTAALFVGDTRRALGVHQESKSALLTADIAAMLAHLPDNLLGIRERALLLVGFAGAFRRSELVGLDVRDLEFTCDGLKAFIRHSKTD